MKVPIRSMYVAPKGKLLLACDLSQAETWVVAFKANEPNMKTALMFGDIHTQTAGSALFYPYECAHDWEKETKKCRVCGRVITKEERYVGKKCNHALSYRMDPPRFAEVINSESDKPPYVTVSLTETKRYYGAWHNYYHIKGWWSEIEERVKRDRMIRTVYGEKRVFFGAVGPELFKEATAYEPQSTVAAHALGAIQPELGIAGGIIGVRKLFREHKEIKLVQTAYDSLVLELPKGLESEIAPQLYGQMYRPLMINNETFSIPVDLELGERFGELEKYELNSVVN